MKIAHLVPVVLIWTFFSSSAEPSSFLDISITNGGFAPQVTVVPVNTLVKWTNDEGVHTTTSYEGLWDSGVLSKGDTFEHTFTEAGIYPYHDTIHDWPSGTIKVVHSLAEMTVRTDRTQYASGDTVHVGLTLSNPGDPVLVGAYVWLEVPGGAMAWLLQIPSVLLPAGFHFDSNSWLTAVLPSLPRGEYSLHTALIKVPENDLITSDSQAWLFGLAAQSDWSGGPGAPDPSSMWGMEFHGSTGIAWRSVAGQLSLTSRVRETPIGSVIALDADRPNFVGKGDLNGDGRCDVITTDPLYDLSNELGAIYWWELSAGGTWSRHVVTGDFYGAEYADSADVDSDGDLDVIAAAYYGDGPGLGRNGRYSWFENLEGDGTVWEAHLVGDLFWGASFIDAGDLDGDGDIDLTGASELTDGIYEQEGDLVWFENLDGSGEVWGLHDLDLDFPNASEAHVVDLDGDDDLDVVGANSDSFGPSQFAWWENVNGDGSAWTKRIIPVAIWGSMYLDVGDIDNDGDLDLLGGGYNGSAVGFWENLDGSGTSWQAWLVGVMPSGLGAELRDIDGDGDLDGFTWSATAMTWFENTDGHGFSWTQRYLTYTANHPWAATADVDDDGKLDLLVTSEEGFGPQSAQIMVYDMSTFLGSGNLTGSILDGGPGPDWGIATWDAEVPADTTLLVEVRASNDETNLGPFVTVPSSGFDLGALIDPQARYLQYRINLSSESPAASPVFHELIVEKGEGF